MTRVSLYAGVTCTLFAFSVACTGSEIPADEPADMGGTTPVDMGPGDQGTVTPTDLGDNTPDASTTEPPCNGCIGTNGACFNGTLNSACGSGGVACVTCNAATGEVCDESACVTAECTADNCDGCCDASGACVASPTDSSCGAGGGTCVDCTANGSTCSEEGVCEAPCGPETCSGCCDASGECVSGGSEEVCGANGEACAACGDEEECELTGSGVRLEQGMCVNTGCASTCEGCCDGDRCLEGDIGESCGTAGAQCEDCGDGSFCAPEQMCMPKSDILWDLVLLQGTFPATKANGDKWDGFVGPDPDPFVKATYIDLSSGDEIEKKSSAASGYAPVWNETLFDDLTAEEVRSTLTFDYIEDDVTFNDVLGEGCAFADINVLFDEQPHILTCGQEVDTNGTITYEGGTFSVRLEKSTS